MFSKVSLLFVFAFLQAVLSQNQQQQQQPNGQQSYIQGMTPTQMWNPYSWSTPYYSAAADSWADYLKKAMEAGNQLYQQWDKTGAGNLFSAGMMYAQQGAQLAQQYAQQAAQLAAQEAMKQSQQAAKTGMDTAQQAMNLVQ